MTRNAHLLSGIVLALAAVQAPAQQVQQTNYLPLSAPDLCVRVGQALTHVHEFFEEFGAPIVVDDKGVTSIETECTDVQYRAARDSGSTLQRAQAFRLLTYAGTQLHELFGLLGSSDPDQRRGAVWLLAQAPDKDIEVRLMVREYLDPLCTDEDPLIRAIVVAMPHSGTSGSRDDDPWVRASWWRGLKSGTQQLPEPLVEYMLTALTDPHPFVREAAKRAHETHAGQIPPGSAAPLDRAVKGLEIDGSPWTHDSWPRSKASDRSVGWLFSLSSWIPLPWKRPVALHGYRDGAVGNPDRLIKRLEFLRSTVSVPHFTPDDLRDSPEPELRATAALMKFPAEIRDPGFAASRLKMIEDPYKDVRIAAAMSFDADSPLPFPSELIGQVQRYIIGGVSSSDPVENRAAVALARGLRLRHAIAHKDFVSKDLVPLLAGMEPGQLAAARDVITTLMGEVPQEAARLLEVATPQPSLTVLLAQATGPDQEAALAAVQELVGRGQEGLILVLTTLSSPDPRNHYLSSNLLTAVGEQPAASMRPAVESAIAALSAEQKKSLKSVVDALRATTAE